MVIEMLTPLTAHEVTEVPRKENIDVDILSKMTQSTPQYISQLTKIKEIRMASIDAIQVNVIKDEDDEWM